MGSESADIGIEFFQFLVELIVGKFDGVGVLNIEIQFFGSLHADDAEKVLGGK